MRARYLYPVILLLALALGGCSSVSGQSTPVAQPTAQSPTAAATAAAAAATPAPSPTVLPTPAPSPTAALSPTAAAASPTAVASPAVTAVSTAVANVGTSAQIAAIKAVIQKADQEQVAAFAKNDPTLMKDTSTSSYYAQISGINSQMASGGVVSIQLLTIEWGQIQVTGSSTATATDYETWRTVYSDSTTEDSRDQNNYTLVLQSGNWLIQTDAQPNSGRGARPPATPSSPSATATPSTGSATPATTPSTANPSHNWSGYAAANGTYTMVTGTWTVPAANLSGGFGSNATWVGIGGVNTRDLIQAGTQEVSDGQGDVTYSAWIEMLPRASQNVPLVVAPGDSVTVTITGQGSNHWQLALKNNTTGKSYSTTVQYVSSQSSAEWIEEAPSAPRQVLPLNDFGKVQFTKATATSNGKTLTIEQAGAQPIQMLNFANQVVAVPSALTSNGEGFTVNQVTPPPTSVPTPSQINPGSGR